MSLRIGDKIGEGTFGLVYRGSIDGIECALKISNKTESGEAESMDEDQMLRYLWRDAKAAAAHIIERIGSLRSIDGRTVVVLRLYKMSVKDALKVKRSGFSLEATARITQQLAEALKFLKEADVMHYDIKPANILLSQDETRVVLSDFGSASFKGPVHSPAGQVRQSLWYRSPEVVLGILPTHAIDMWSLGAVIAEVYTGRVAFPTRGHFARGLDASQSELVACHEYRLGRPYPNDLCEQGSLSGRNAYLHRYNAFVFLLKNLFDNIQEVSLENLEQADSLVALLERVLVYDPEKRATPIEVLEHTFCTEEAQKAEAIDNVEKPIQRNRLQKTFREYLA